uniref:Uncharacterized protein n=1 Tax=Parascaris equorum TaxID=6256 RepID=A0A914SAT9_PAREQ
MPRRSSYRHNSPIVHVQHWPVILVHHVRLFHARWHSQLHVPNRRYPSRNRRSQESSKRSGQNGHRKVRAQ